MGKPSLSVLITNLTLKGRSGTEIVTRNAALGLLRAGHRPVVYSPSIDGPIATELRHASIPVTDDIRKIAHDIDVIHGHHTAPTATAIARFPDVPAIFLCHDFTAWHDAAPHFPNVGRYVGVDQTTADRLRFQEGVPADKVRVLLNAVDLDRCRPGPDLPASPRNALIIAKNAGHIEPIKAACTELGIAVEVIGKAVGRVVEQPETAMAGCDLVFGSALGALEAMACGRAVVACDGRGLAGMVLPDTFDAWRPLNFGVRSLLRRVTVEAIRDEIGKYDRNAAASLSLRVRSEAGLEPWIERLIGLYREVIAEHGTDPARAAGMALPMAAHLQDWQHGLEDPKPWQAEREQLLHRLEEATSTTPLRLGSRLTFDQHCRLHGAQLYGFGEPEDWGVWTIGDEASVALFLSARPDTDLIAEIDLFVFHAEGHDAQDVDVLVNGFVAARWSFRGSKVERHTRRIAVRSASIRTSRTLWFAFRFSRAISPLELGIGPDTRKLALGLSSIKLDPLDPPAREEPG